MREAFPCTRFQSFAALILAVMGVCTISTLAPGWATAKHICIGEASYRMLSGKTL